MLSLVADAVAGIRAVDVRVRLCNLLYPWSTVEQQSPKLRTS